jgi:hypothetical protein
MQVEERALLPSRLQTSSQPKIRQQWLSAAGDRAEAARKQNQKQGLISALALDFS